MAKTYALSLAPRRGDKTSTPSHSHSEGAGSVLGILLGVVLLGVAGLVVGRNLWGRRRNLPPEPPHIDPRQAWEAAGPSIAMLGFKKSDENRFIRDEGTHESASLHIKDDKTFHGSLNGQAPGGVIETFLKKEAYVSPGFVLDDSPCGRWAYESAAAAIVRLPHDARVHVEGPDLPGERYEVEVYGSLFAPQHAAAAAEVMILLAEAARKAASPDALIAALPRGVRLMMEASADLTALGLRKDTVIAYSRSGSGTCSVHVNDDDTLTGRYRKSLPDAAIERYIGVSETIHPGSHSGHELCRWVMAELATELAALPHKANIAITVAKLPGDDTEVRVALPFTAVAEAGAVARLLLAFERMASPPLPPGSPPAPFSPLAQRWIAAGPLLVAAGLHKGSPDSYRRDGGSLSVEVDVDDETLEGRIHREASERKITLYAGTEVELAPGDAGRTPLGTWVAGVVREPLAALPRGTTLKVEAPKRAGDTYTLRVEAPFKDPVHAKAIAELLMMLDTAAQGPPV